MCERYGEALDTARKAIEEFPKQDAFRKLATEAEALKREQDDRERARNEMQRRVREINSKINQDKITDAIDLAQQTMETMGPDPNVTQLLQGAEEKRKKKEDAERKVTAAQTLVNKGDHAGATQHEMKRWPRKILQPSDPRMQELSRKRLHPSRAGSKREVRRSIRRRLVCRSLPVLGKRTNPPLPNLCFRPATLPWSANPRKTFPQQNFPPRESLLRETGQRCGKTVLFPGGWIPTEETRLSKRQKFQMRLSLPALRLASQAQRRAFPQSPDRVEPWPPPLRSRFHQSSQDRIF